MWMAEVCFTEKTLLDISCESSAEQTINMQYVKPYFRWKYFFLRMLSATILHSTLRVTWISESVTKHAGNFYNQTAFSNSGEKMSIVSSIIWCCQLMSSSVCWKVVAALISTFTTPSANSAEGKLMTFFLFFPENRPLTFHANCLPRRRFAWNITAYFLKKKRKVFQNVICWNYLPACWALTGNHISFWVTITMACVPKLKEPWNLHLPSADDCQYVWDHISTDCRFPLNYYNSNEIQANPQLPIPVKSALQIGLT